MDGDTYDFAYNGLGDRLRQTVNGAATEYTLDIASRPACPSSPQ